MNYHFNQIEYPQALLKKYTDVASLTPTCLTFTFNHSQHYLSNTVNNNEGISLNAAILIHDTSTLCIVSQSAQFPENNTSLPAEAYFASISKFWAIDAVELNSPWHLETLRIPKPWGAEIWYTGMEDRGICTVDGLPLPWLLDMTEADTGEVKTDPILLKILDPFSDRNSGDLYFELHEEKIEVYIVTSIDESVWPDGIGKIRYGFSQSKISQFDSLKEFKSAYLDAVRQYQVVRNEIDVLIDAGSEITASLNANEDKLKIKMYSFTEMKNLSVGDVVQVQPFFPHSLQHGVRVIEFQTAHYERHILSFTQKVLTQNHWDTEKALEKVETVSPKDKPLKILEDTDGIILESIAEFDQFSTFRLSIKTECKFHLNLDKYALIIGIQGSCDIIDRNNGIQKLVPERSFFLASELKQVDIKATKEDVVLLIAKQN